MNVEENVTLLSCPFCGHKPMAWHIVTDGKSLYSVGCSNDDCIAHGCLNMTFANVKDAVSLWNDRISNGDGFVKINVIQYEREVVKS